jgi:hypothetical protein
MPSMLLMSQCNADNDTVLMCIQVGLPSFCRKFNGKPILIHGKESSFCRDVALGRAELDVNAHAFSFIGRKVSTHDTLLYEHTKLYVLCI